MVSYILGSYSNESFLNIFNDQISIISFNIQEVKGTHNGGDSEHTS